METKNEAQELKSRQGYEWIKGESGTSYLCPAGSIPNKKNVTEEQLKKVCVDESQSPQND